MSHTAPQINTEGKQLLILSSEFPPGPGGIGTHAFEVSRHLHQSGWNVQVLTLQDYVTVMEADCFNAEQPFSITRLPSQCGALRGMAGRLRILSAHIRQQRPNVLLATGERMVWLAAHIAKRFHLPWLAVGHGTEFGASTGMSASVTRWAFGQASMVVCVSEFTKKLMEAGGIRPRNVIIIPNGADGDRFRVLSESEIAPIRQRLGIGAAPLILTVGQVTERKGQEVVIRALPELLKSVPDVHYAMIGLPSRQVELTAIARESGVLERIHFLGRLDNQEVVRYLNACDVFVMTSVRTRTGDCEGYGIAVVEAALCGKPAVVSANSGLAEAIADGETGIAVPENNPGETARALVQLLKKTDLRRTMGEAAQLRARREQLWQHRVAVYDEQLQSLLAVSLSQAETRDSGKLLA